MSLHISIKGEELFEFHHFPVTNSFITTLLVIVIFFFIANYYFVQSGKRKKGLGFYAIHSALKVMYDMFHSILHNKVNYFFALLGSFMFFILLNNWSGLIPGVGSIMYTIHHAGEIEHVPLLRSGTADLNTTIALAGISVIITQIFGFQFIGAQKHLSKYFIFKNPIMFFVGILELLLEVARIISFSFRLFGNIFAGEVLLTLLPFLLPLVLSFVTSPLYLMEIFVGFIQAFVFVILSTIFINMATSYEH